MFSDFACGLLGTIMRVNVSGYLCAGVYLEEVCSYRLSYREERLLRIADCLYPRREQDTCCQDYSDSSQDGNLEQRPHDSDRVRYGRVCWACLGAS